VPSIRRLISVKPGEGKRTLILFLQYFFVVAVTIAGKSARDTFFLSRFDKSYLPLMYVVCAFVVALAAALFARASRKTSTAMLLNATCALFVAGILLLSLRIEGFIIPVLYTWVEIIVSLSTLQFWLLASDVFDPRQAKRLFGIVGGGGSLAAIIVGTGVKPFVKMFGPNALLVFVAAAVVAYWALGRTAMKFVVPRPRPQRAAPKASRTARLDTYLLSITVVVALSAIVSQVVDYQFKIIASQSFPNEANLAGFFGNFYALTGVASLIVQFFLTSAVLSRFGLLAGLVILPVFLNIGTLAILLRPQLWSGAFAKFSDQVFKFTLNNSALELLWLPVAPEKRQIMRPTISGTYKSFSEVGAGLLTFFLVKVVSLPYLGILSLAALIVWLGTVFRIKALYTKALVSAIEKRQIDMEDLTIDVQDPEMVAIIERTLNSGDEVRQIFALELIDGLPLGPWTKTFGRLMKEGSPSVRARILALCDDNPSIVSDDLVINAMSWPDDAAPEAIRLAGFRRLAPALPKLLTLMDSPDPAIRAASAVSVLELDPNPSGPAYRVLAELLDQPNPQTRALAIDRLSGNLDILPPARLQGFLADPAPFARIAAMQVAAARRDVAYLPAIVNSLEDPRTAPAARTALRSFPEDAVLAAIAGAYPKPGPSVIRALADYPNDASIALLIAALEPREPAITSLAAQTLLAIARRQPLPPPTIDRTEAETSILVHNAYASNRLLKLMPTGAGSLLLRDHFTHRIHDTIPALIRFKSLSKPGGHIETAIQIVQSADKSRLPFVLELLDEALRREQQDLWGGLLEPLPVEERDAIGARQFTDLPQDLPAELNRLAESGTTWEKAIAQHYLRSGVNWERGSDSAAMFSTLEKTILLKSVSLFRDIPAEKLSRVAHIAEETRWPADSSILREGEPGDSLFIVVEGSVRIHKGGHDLATLVKGDCLGEMALLDQAPRSADATAIEDAILLRLGQEDFFDVMSANPEIMQGILRLLTRRLREANEKLSAKS
jgi:ATP/ADP translocase